MEEEESRELSTTWFEEEEEAEEEESIFEDGTRPSLLSMRCVNQVLICFSFRPVFTMSLSISLLTRKKGRDNVS